MLQVQYVMENMDIGNHKFTYMKEKYNKTSFIAGNNDFRHVYTLEQIRIV